MNHLSQLKEPECDAACSLPLGMEAAKMASTNEGPEPWMFQKNAW
jgi:hypothetical protein